MFLICSMLSKPDGRGTSAPGGEDVFSVSCVLDMLDVYSTRCRRAMNQPGDVLG
jgi:hypothetical protein